MTSPKRILYWLVSLVLSTLAFLVFGELFVRSLPFLFSSYASTRFREYDPLKGVSLIPNTVGPHHRGCFNGEIKVNRWGMRDRERSIKKQEGTYRIALLGDSLIEGAHVLPEEVVNIKMEELLSRRGYSSIEVLNFGLGGIGTTQEFLIYENHVRRFQPDLVLLIFLTSNDVMNNSSTIQPKVYGIHQWYAPYFEVGSQGELVFREVEERPMNTLRSFLERYSLLVHYIDRIWHRVNFGQELWKGLPLQWGVFGEPLGKEWEVAWKITEKVLVLLERTVKVDGSRFTVLVAPEFFEIDPDWRKRMTGKMAKLPPELKPFEAMQRLQQIAARRGIQLEFLGPYFERYRDSHNLLWPYFSLTCDPHFSAFGHRELARAILDKLEERILLPDSK